MINCKSADENAAYLELQGQIRQITREMRAIREVYAKLPKTKRKAVLAKTKAKLAALDLLRFQIISTFSEKYSVEEMNEFHARLTPVGGEPTQLIPLIDY